MTGARVFVTGSEGFIGSHLVEALVRAGATVRALVLYNSFGRTGWLADLPPEISDQVEIVLGDVRDQDRIRHLVQGSQLVFHLASLIAIPYSYLAPQSYVDTNVTGAVNVLTACRDLGVERLLFTSTSEVYGTARRVPMDESHPLQGQSPYSASKIGADMLAESFHRAYGLPVTIVRPFNTFGPRQSARAVIPAVLGQLARGAETIRLGALSPVRDFTYVTDTVAGFLALAACQAALGRVVNLGSGRGVSIAQLVELIFAATGRRAEISCEAERLRPPASEVERLICDPSLAHDLAGWKAAVSLEQGLERTARWIEANPGHFTATGYAI